MNLVALLLAIIAAIIADYLAFNHQAPLYIVLAFCATIVAVLALIDGVGTYNNNGRTL